MNRFEERLSQGLQEIAGRAIPSPTAWQTIRERIDNQDQADTSQPEVTMLEVEEPQDQRRRRVLAALLVAAAILVVAGGFATTRFITGEEVAIDAQSPADLVVASYFESFNAGDAEAAVALFAPDLEIADRFVASRDQWEKLVHWYIGQGAHLTPPSCETTAVTVTSTTITCAYQNRHVVHLAKDVPGVALQSVFVIESDLITAFDHGFTGTGDIGQSFADWVKENHPDDLQAIDCCTWATIQDARAAGELVADHANEWASN
jgi:hypothetical protein